VGDESTTNVAVSVESGLVAEIVGEGCAVAVNTLDVAMIESIVACALPGEAGKFVGCTGAHAPATTAINVRKKTFFIAASL
jgi:hypothetical protein